MSIVVNPEVQVDASEVITSEVTSGSINYAGTTEVTLASVTLTAGKWLLLASCSLESPTNIGFIFITTTTQDVGRVANRTRSFFFGSLRTVISTQGTVDISATTTFLLRVMQSANDTTAAYLSSISAAIDNPDNAIVISAIRIA